MKTIRISDSKIVGVLILEKMLSLALLSKNPDLVFDEDDETELSQQAIADGIISKRHYIFNTVDLGEVNYLIPASIFSEVMKALETKGIIKIDWVEEEDVIDRFEDHIMFCEFVKACVIADHSVDIKELLKTHIAFFEISDIRKIQSEIDYLKSLGFDFKKIKTDKKSQGDLEQIRNIDIVIPNKKEGVLVVVNKKYSEAITVLDSSSKNIVAYAEAILKEENELKIEKPKVCRDYLNSNHSCRLYRDRSGKKQLYSLTELVRIPNSLMDQKKLFLNPEIKTNKITRTEFNKRLTDQNSKFTD